MQEKQLRKIIIDELKEQGLYNKVKLLLVDQLVYQYQLQQALREDILVRGLVMDVTKKENKESYYNLNHSFAAIQKCTEKIQSLLKQLFEIKKKVKKKGEESDISQLQKLFEMK